MATAAALVQPPGAQARDVQQVEMAEINPHGALNQQGNAGMWEGTSDDGFGGSSSVCNVPPEIRSGFIRKVYCILTIMIALTTAIAAPFMAIPKEWIVEHNWLAQACGLTSMVLMLGLSCCCQEVMRRAPLNYLLALVYVILLSVFLGFVIASYRVESVLLALALTVLIFMGLTAYACCTQSDFTGIGPYLFCALFGLMAAGFVISMMGIFMELPPIVQQIYGVCGALLFCFYIIYDTQQIMGGKKFECGIDDYMWAALELYLDIINLFIILLELMGDRRD